MVNAKQRKLPAYLLAGSIDTSICCCSANRRDLRSDDIERNFMYCEWSAAHAHETFDSEVYFHFSSH